MGQQLWTNPIDGAVALADGPTLTAAAAASCLPTAAKVTLANNFFKIGKQLRVTASGRISCVAASPGAARYDVRIGTVVAFDSQAIPLNVVAKTNVGWWLEILLTCRSVGSGTATQLFGQGRWLSEAGVGAPAVTVGGSGGFLLPFNSVPVLGAGFDGTAANTLDLFFTQTVGTGSMTLHQYLAEEIG